MAHFAKLNTQNKVIAVHVVNNDVFTTEDEGIAFLESLYGQEEGIAWKQTSYNANIRKNFASIGDTYDETRDAFIPPQPSFPSWSLNETTCRWEPPVAYPDDGLVYHWNEETQAWDEAE